MVTELVLESTYRSSCFPLPFFANHPHDEVLADLLSASEIAPRCPEPAVVQLAEATQRRVHEIQRDIRRRLARQKAQITISDVELLIERIAWALRTTTEALRGNSRKLHTAFQRQLSIYLCRRISGASYQTIGVAINCDHRTVIHALDVIAGRVARDPTFGEFVDRIQTQVTSAMSAAEAVA